MPNIYIFLEKSRLLKNRFYFFIFISQVAQAVALELDIPMEKIRIKPTYNFVTPNSSTTGGSITSELCCFVRKKILQYFS